MNIITKIGIAAAGVIAASQIIFAQPVVPGSPNIKVVPGSFIVVPDSCPNTGDCTITASAIWQNEGDGDGTVTPGFIVDGETHSSPSAVILTPGKTAEYRVTVAVSPTTANHKVCPVPNP